MTLDSAPELLGVRKFVAELASEPMQPSQRSLRLQQLHGAVLTDHAKLRRKLRSIEGQAARLQAAAPDASALLEELRAEVRNVVTTLTHHVEAWHRLLASLGDDAGESGRLRLELLRVKHGGQMRLLSAYAAAIEGTELGLSAAALVAAQLADLVRKNLDFEAETLRALDPAAPLTAALT